MKEWWEPSEGTFSRDMAAVLFSPASVEAAKREAAAIKRWLGLRRGAQVLDAACGVGRHSLALAALGLDVRGVDLTPAYVAEARRRARVQGLKNARFERGDIRDLRRHAGSADLVINLFSSFGYFVDEADDRQALSAMAQALKPGGRLLMELTIRETVEPRFLERDWSGSGGAYIMQHRYWMDGKRRIQTDYVICANGRISKGQFNIRLYTKAQMRALFKGAGLTKIQAFGGFDGRPWRPGSRLILTGVR